MRRITVGEVMTTQVVTARRHLPFKEIARLMHEHGVSGLPVVDEEGRIEGIVTEADLLRGMPKERAGSPWLQWLIEHWHPDDVARLHASRAEDVMTRRVVTTTPETPVQEAIERLMQAGVKRLPVVDEAGRVIGIVSRRDLLRPFLRPDEEIRREVQHDVLLRTMWIDPDTILVAVHGGVVTLRGEVDRRSIKEILVEMVRRVDGVVGVEDHLTYREDDRKVGPGPVRAPLRGALRLR